MSEELEGARAEDDEDEQAEEEARQIGLQPWEQRPNEPAHHYHVFEIFCHLGWQRSVRKAAEKWYAETGETPPKHPGARFNDVAVKWQWQKRANVYWIAERRRAECLLQERRDALALRFMDLGEKTLGKYEKAFGSLEPHKNGKAYIEGLSKLKELLLGPDDDHKRAGRPSEQDDALPSIDDRLKPPEEPQTGEPVNERNPV